MRILIGTNILIPLEDTCGVLCSTTLASGNGHQIIVHTALLDDLQRDKDDTRKQILLSKAQKYPPLESPPINLSSLGWQREKITIELIT